MSAHFPTLQAVKKAPEPVLMRLNEISAEIVKLEIERQAILMVIAAYETSMLPKNAEDHKVDYGKPPLHTRFAKGQSGNPLGRPAEIGLDQSIMLILSHSNTPLRRREIADQLPGTSVKVVSTMLNKLKARGLVKKTGVSQWEKSGNADA
jgi:CRP-like cAMP-binding protein